MVRSMKLPALLLSTSFAVFVAVLGLAIVSTSDAQSPYNSRRTFFGAELLAAAITATGPTGASGASGILLTTLASDCSIASFENTTAIEIDALIGAQKKRVPAGQFRQFPLGAANSRWAAGTVIKVYGNGVAPTGGAFEFTCQPY